MKLTSPPPATFTLMTNSAQSPESSPVSFAKLLAPLLADLAPDVLPAFLARLERTAAARYRQWSRDVPAWTSDLLACADAEDEIANRILAAFPISAEWATALDERVPAAREIYFSAFDGLAVLDQLRLQAAAERQGAQAWGSIASRASGLSDDVHAVLAKCSALEERSADLVDALLDRRSRTSSN